MACSLLVNPLTVSNEAIVAECLHSSTFSPTLDVVAIIVSIISLIATGLIAYLNYRHNNKISRINIASDYFKEIYKEILVKHIPSARSALDWSEDGTLQNHGDLCDKIVSLKNKSLYYKYTNPNYYKKLCDCVEKAEDSICGTSNRKLDVLGRAKALGDIEKLIQELYVCVNHGLNGEDFK